MLMTSSEVPSIALLDVAVATSPEPVGRTLDQQLARTLERIVLALRMPLPVIRHQDAAQVGMAVEHDPEHVEHLALEPVRCRPHVRDGGHPLAVRDPDLQPH